MTDSQHWLALVVGNTRLHWGYFDQERFLDAWHTPHLSRAEINQLLQHQFQGPVVNAHVADRRRSSSGWPVNSIQHPISPANVWIVSAVPAQTSLWTEATHGANWKLNWVERSHLPIQNMYPTLGLDRAVTLLGAGAMMGWPTLVIDGGTALTFTAGISTGNHQGGRLYGGAILPGLRLQQESLRKGARALDNFVSKDEPSDLPGRWAVDSVGAIASGLTYSLSATLLDYLRDWWSHFPTGHAVITGGDATQLHTYLKQRTPEVASRVKVDPNLMFYGVQAYRQALRI